nr:hypothetical protein [Tanacetum cinerariifolium]
MAALRYKDEHNKVGYLFKPTGSDDYHQIINFLRASHIRYALTHNPIIFDSLVKQFWSIATLKAPELADDGGIDDLPIAEIYSGMDNLGYVTEVKLTFFKNKFSPQRRQQTSDPNALVLEHGQSLDPNTASFSRSHETDAGPLTNMEDAPVGDTFHISLPRSTQAPPTGQPSGGAEGPITLTTLSSIVSTLVQKVNSLETELKDHKKLFKDVVGELVKKVKAMEVKLKTKKRKIVVSDSDQEDGGKQEMDLDALRTLANTAVTVDTNIPPGDTSQILVVGPSVASTVSPGASTISPGALTVSPGASTIPASSLRVPTDVSPSVAPAGVSYKGKSLMVDEDILVKVRTFMQMQEDILGEQAAKRTVKRSGPVLEEPSSQMQKSIESLISSMPETFIKVVVNEDSDDEGSLIWFALIGWELIPTHLGDVNALYQLDDVSYPLSVKLMERMLMHKLEIDADVVGNDMTTVEQLIQFIKNQLAAAQAFCLIMVLYNSVFVRLFAVSL